MLKDTKRLRSGDTVILDGLCALVGVAEPFTKGFQVNSFFRAAATWQDKKRDKAYGLQDVSCCDG